LDAVIKVGGSLSETLGAVKALGNELFRLAKKYQIILVPGGGKFADAVREFDAKFSLEAAASHKMAILAMDQYGLFLSQTFKGICPCDSLEDATESSASGKAVVFLPSKLMFQEDPFTPSWDVTSDSIAAYIACKFKASKVVFATDVDGIFNEDPKTHSDARLLSEVSPLELIKRSERTSVDKFLPNFLLENQLDCYVVNGLFPRRISDILAGHQTICTRILLR